MAHEGDATGRPRKGVAGDSICGRESARSPSLSSSPLKFDSSSARPPLRTVYQYGLTGRRVQARQSVSQLHVVDGRSFPASHGPDTLGLTRHFSVRSRQPDSGRPYRKASLFGHPGSMGNLLVAVDESGFGEGFLPQGEGISRGDSQ